MTSENRDRPDRCGRYRSLSNFYLADARRIASRERDLGLWWRVGAHGPMYRAAWVADTGELYVVRLGPAEDGTGQVDVLGSANDRNDLERALAGWRDICRQPDSMTWLRHRAATLDQPDMPRVLSRELTDFARTGRRLQQAKAAVDQTNGRTHDARLRCPPSRSVPASNDLFTRRGRQLSTQRSATGLDEPLPGRATSTGGFARVKLMALVGAVAGVTAPATALVLELVGG